MQKKAAFTIVEVLVVICVFLAMITFLAPLVKITQARARRINCVNNLRQISLGLHKYALGHNKAFPEKIGDLYPTYISDKKVFDCRGSKRIGTKDDPDYSYTEGLAESAPAWEIIVRDNEGNHKNSGKNILRVDGSVEWVSNK